MLSFRSSGGSAAAPAPLKPQRSLSTPPIFKYDETVVSPRLCDCAMCRSQRVSNGELPNYGRQHHNPLQQADQWRARLKNERTGSHITDYSGSNTYLSMVWDSSSDAGKRGAARRTSELHMQNDFGTHVQQAGSNAAKSNRSVVSERPVPGCRMSTLQHYARAGSLVPEEAATYSAMTPEEKQLHSHAREADSRVAQAAKERELGTNYLRVGNLKQARKHLARAEELLQLDGQKTGELDELQLIKKDTFF